MLTEFKRRIENISSSEFQKVICAKFTWRKKSNRKGIQTLENHAQTLSTVLAFVHSGIESDIQKAP